MEDEHVDTSEAVAIFMDKANRSYASMGKREPSARMMPQNSKEVATPSPPPPAADDEPPEPCVQEESQVVMLRSSRAPWLVALVIAFLLGLLIPARTPLSRWRR